MEIAEYKAKIERSPEGFYLFVGEEEYLKRHYLSELKKKLVPDAFLEPFNYAVFDGGEIDFGKLLDAMSEDDKIPENITHDKDEFIESVKTQLGL